MNLIHELQHHLLSYGYSSTKTIQDLELHIKFIYNPLSLQWQQIHFIGIQGIGYSGWLIRLGKKNRVVELLWIILDKNKWKEY